MALFRLLPTVAQAKAERHAGASQVAQDRFSMWRRARHASAWGRMQIRTTRQATSQPARLQAQQARWSVRLMFTGVACITESWVEHPLMVSIEAMMPGQAVGVIHLVLAWTRGGATSRCRAGV